MPGLHLLVIFLPVPWPSHAESTARTSKEEPCGPCLGCWPQGQPIWESVSHDWLPSRTQWALCWEGLLSGSSSSWAQVPRYWRLGPAGASPQASVSCRFCGECLQPCLQVPSPLCPLCRLPFDPKKVDKATHVEKQLSSYKAPCRGCNKKVLATWHSGQVGTPSHRRPGTRLCSSW